MTQVEAELSALIKAAAERPGTLLTGYGVADREHARKLAREHRRQADALDLAAQTGEQGTE